MIQMIKKSRTVQKLRFTLNRIYSLAMDIESGTDQLDEIAHISKMALSNIDLSPIPIIIERFNINNRFCPDYHYLWKLGFREVEPNIKDPKKRKNVLNLKSNYALSMNGDFDFFIECKCVKFKLRFKNNMELESFINAFRGS